MAEWTGLTLNHLYEFELQFCPPANRVGMFKTDHTNNPVACAIKMLRCVLVELETRYEKHCPKKGDIAAEVGWKLSVQSKNLNEKSLPSSNARLWTHYSKMLGYLLRGGADSRPAESDQNREKLRQAIATRIINYFFERSTHDPDSVPFFFSPAYCDSRSARRPIEVCYAAMHLAHARSQIKGNVSLVHISDSLPFGLSDSHGAITEFGVALLAVAAAGVQVHFVISKDGNESDAEKDLDRFEAAAKKLTDWPDLVMCLMSQPQFLQMTPAIGLEAIKKHPIALGPVVWQTQLFFPLVHLVFYRCDPALPLFPKTILFIVRESDAQPNVIEGTSKETEFVARWLEKMKIIPRT